MDGKIRGYVLLFSNVVVIPLFYVCRFFFLCEDNQTSRIGFLLFFVLFDAGFLVDFGSFDVIYREFLKSFVNFT